MNNNDKTPIIDLAPLALNDRNEAQVERRRSARAAGRDNLQAMLAEDNGTFSRTENGWQFVFGTP